MTIPFCWLDAAEPLRAVPRGGCRTDARSCRGRTLSHSSPLSGQSKNILHLACNLSRLNVIQSRCGASLDAPHAGSVWPEPGQYKRRMRTRGKTYGDPGAFPADPPPDPVRG